MDDITRQNAAQVEQTAGAAEAMRGQAAELAQLVGAFRLVARQRRAAREQAQISDQSGAAMAALPRRESLSCCFSVITKN